MNHQPTREINNRIKEYTKQYGKKSLFLVVPEGYTAIPGHNKIQVIFSPDQEIVIKAWVNGTPKILETITV